MKKYRREEIIRAKNVLEIPEHASIEFIKKRYRELVKKYHPDKYGKGGEDKIKEINGAYEVIRHYTDNYPYSFSEEAVARYNPEAGSPFCGYNDPYWGG
ncbi:MAG TPA: molecular chaperone DnaJ [Firmicutes bacterium]|nr:molecular chaperone DnaJ [Bacillota bacterium]